VHQYRHPLALNIEIENIIQKLLEASVICPIISHYFSPIVVALKIEGNWCMCLDFHALNKKTIKDKIPILVIDVFLDELHGTNLFTKLDLCSGYNQTWMKEMDIPKTVSHTHEEHYEFLVIPFGLYNAPSTI
jgi:uncharacterized metal-binding protein